MDFSDIIMRNAKDRVHMISWKNVDIHYKVHSTAISIVMVIFQVKLVLLAVTQFFSTSSRTEPLEICGKG